MRPVLSEEKCAKFVLKFKNFILFSFSVQLNLNSEKRKSFMWFLPQKRTCSTVSQTHICSSIIWELHCRQESPKKELNYLTSIKTYRILRKALLVQISALGLNSERVRENNYPKQGLAESKWFTAFRDYSCSCQGPRLYRDYCSKISRWWKNSIGGHW